MHERCAPRARAALTWSRDHAAVSILTGAPRALYDLRRRCAGWSTFSSDAKSLLERRCATNLRHPNFLSRAASRAMWDAKLLGGSWGGARTSCGGARAASRLGGAAEGELGGEGRGDGRADSWGGARLSCSGARAASCLVGAGEGELGGEELGKRRTGPPAERCLRRASLARRRLRTFRAHLAATLFGVLGLAPVRGMPSLWVPVAPTLGRPGLVVGPRVGCRVRPGVGGVVGRGTGGCQGWAQGFSRKAGDQGRARARRGAGRQAGNQGRARALSRGEFSDEVKIFTLELPAVEVVAVSPAWMEEVAGSDVVVHLPSLRRG